MVEPESRDARYRMADGLILRIVGGLVLLTAGLLLVVAVVVVALDLPAVILVITALTGLVLASGVGWWLRTRATLVRLTGEGYAVRLVRGAGVRAAAWRQVSEVATATPRGVACVLLRLEDGRMTTIPVVALAVDREQFVRDLQQRLQIGHGLRRPS